MVSNSKFLSGSCRVIQLLPRGSWLSPNPLGDAPVRKTRAQPSVSKGPLEHSCRQNGLVCAVLTVHCICISSFTGKQVAVSLSGGGRRGFPKTEKGRGDRHLRRRHLPSQRLHLRRHRRRRTRPSPPSHPRQPRPGFHRVMGQVRATRPRAGRSRGAGIWRPPAPFALWPPRRSSPRPAPSPQSKLEPPADSGRGRRSRAAPIPRVALGWAYTNAP